MDDLQAKIVQIPRKENKQANRLAKASSVEYMITPDNVLSFVQLSPLIDYVDVQEIAPEDNWTTPLVSYLKKRHLTRREGSRKKVEGPSNVIRYYKRRLIQERVLPFVSKVFRS